MIIVYSLVSDKQEADMLAKSVIAKKLAACVNILAPCTSYFEWEGEVQNEIEIPILFKTTDDKWEALRDHIKEIHSYDVPAILKLPVEDAHTPYMDWLKTQVI